MNSLKDYAVSKTVNNNYNNSNNIPIKTLTRGCTDPFAAGITYLHFPIQVCFSPLPVFPVYSHL